uniref:Reverse transcriptase domain-containing protein n=1 Tax=Tanacetum cinerariifolium TaxID=118510 RepID=A0A6L2NHN4_TANCI|nr:reverse transcriptase domain-containing protein [Tanacetum cinerariifolium]
MEELLEASTKGYREAIVIPEINTYHFEIKTNLLQLVQANPYHGFERENPHTYINNFKWITSTLKFRDVPNDVIKLMMFPYSLEGSARVWYDKEPPNSILTWEDLVNKFMNNFFPPSKTTHLKNEISQFTQRFKETFGEAWERFKEMLRACPHHGFTELTQIDTFFNGLNENDQDSLNATVGGNLLSKTTIEDLHIIENKSKVCYSRNKPNVSRINTTSRENVSKTDDRIDKLADEISTLVDIFSKKFVTPTTVKAVKESCICTSSFADALLLMPKFASTIKRLLANKDKLFELAKIPFNENCSAMILKNLPEKLGDLGKFLIPCDFSGMDVCHALADLGASINLMPLSIWKKLSLPKLTPIRMTLELADRFITHPKGVAEDVFVKVGKFHFLTDFVVVDLKADPRVPLILRRSFLRIGRATIDVYGEEITLLVNDEAITFNLNQTTRYSSTYDDMSVNRIDIIDVTREEYAQEMLGFSNKFLGGNPTSTSEPIILDSSPSLTLFEGSDFILEEIEAYLKMSQFHQKLIMSIQGEVVKAKSSTEEPSELELKDLPSHLEYAYLEGADKLPVIIEKDLNVDEKEALLKVLKSYKRAIAWKITDIKGIDPRFVLGQCKTKHFQPIHYASKTMNEAQIHYTMTEKEMLTVVYAFEKFRPYLVLSKSIVYTDHSDLKYLLSKQDAKPRLLWWVLLLQEFDIIIRDKKGMKNLNENFPLETLGKISSGSTPWFADFANFHAGNIIIKEISSQQKKKFLRTLNTIFRTIPIFFEFVRIKSFDVDYLSKWVEAKVLPTNDARVVVKFFKSLFARFGTPRAIISDRGTYFCNDKFAKVMSKYGVTHPLAIAYHPQTSGQVEVSNHGLKHILERTVGENYASWSKKLEDALWAFKTAYKTPIGCTPYKSLRQIDGKADEGFFVGYSLKSKAFRVFNSRTRIVEENLHFRFSESTPNVVGSDPDWLFDIDALTRTMNYEPIVVDT